eukprot:CAMPEP_0179480916 /NCGR_PEP_ID=MMETSP0799-20121207/58765_1 /TAXON_ID=46947 /ORGANISM="Geminigera cryophila, Strain CCMP2564" /LENGTH=482 /DNA_ID=CAMNT_0021293243 /DNA_START=292 /DNA_END=1738 /DNA_ORIENTATION=-
MAGKDVIARARTGTGKTLSFVLPVHERMVALRKEGLIDSASKRGRPPVCLILSPTRELTKQIGKVFETVAAGSLTVLTVYGGVPYDQQGNGLRAGVDVVVGTPGRVTDFMEKGQLKMDKIRFFVLDEADEMLNIGFKEHVDKIFAQVVGDMGEGAGINEERQAEVQTMLFSATVPAWIKEVTTKYFKKETTVNVDLVASDKTNETALRNSTSDELALDDAIKQECAVLHGDIAQAQRETTFQAFREGKFKCLVATDVAARGLDIPEIDLVIMCHPTKDPDTYVHRAGRTGRAGRSGVAVTFFTPRELSLLRLIERRIKIPMTQVSAPQPGDIVKANARDLRQSVGDVHEEVFPLFEAIAEEMIKDMGAVQALCAAMAVACGHTKPLPAKSMLTSLEGFKTFTIALEEGQEPMTETREVFPLLRKVLPQSAVSSIKGLRLFKPANKAMGCAFDVPVDKVEEFIKAKAPPGSLGLSAINAANDM